MGELREIIERLRFQLAAILAEQLFEWSAEIHPNKYRIDYLRAQYALLEAQYADLRNPAPPAETETRAPAPPNGGDG